jgi:uncharacterized protein (DUF952 family)
MILPPSPSVIYKISPRDAWEAAQAEGRFTGAPVDVQDGYIHFSTAPQARETAARHFAGQDNLVLVAIDASALGAALLWEPSRGGNLFPHLYAPLLMEAVLWVCPLPLAEDGSHTFPAVLP